MNQQKPPPRGWEEYLEDLAKRAEKQGLHLVLAAVRREQKELQKADNCPPNKMNQSDRLYAIYNHPTDYPGHWVVRGWEYRHGQEQPDAEPILCSSLEEAQQHIKKLCPEAVLIDNNDPDPHLAEVWK